MTANGFIELSPHTVLRADPDYFGSFTLFDVIAFRTYELSPLEFALLWTVAQSEVPASAYELAVERIGNSFLWDELLTARVLRYVSTSPKPVEVPNIPNALGCEVPRTSAPTELELCITRRCNQSCVHCNVSAVGLNKGEKLGTEFWLDLIKQAKALGVHRITLTGGEPLVRDDIVPILDALSDRRLGVIVLTNGTRITQELIPSIRASGAVLSISIDGATAAVHDQFRRYPGGFAAAQAGMRLLRNADVMFVISCVVHDLNVSNLEPMLVMSREMGASRLIVVPMARVGRGASRRSESWLPDNRVLSEALGRIRQRAMMTPGPDVTVGNGDTKEIIAVRDRYSGATAMSRRNPGFCKAGIFSMAVDEDGRAYSCLRGVQTKIYPLADLRTTSLAQAWDSVSWAPFRDSKIEPVPCRVEALQANRKTHWVRLRVIA